MYPAPSTALAHRYGQLSRAGGRTNGTRDRESANWVRNMTLMSPSRSSSDFTSAFHVACTTAAQRTIRKTPIDIVISRHPVEVRVDLVACRRARERVAFIAKVAFGSV